MADHAALGLWKLRLLDQAQSASRAKSDFMAAVSHELRTPLAALSGYGEILSERVAGPLSAEQQDVVDRMRSVTDHLSGLIEEILTYSSLDAGLESVEVRVVSVADVMRDSVVVVEPLAARKGIGFNHEAAPDAVLLTDAGKLRHILVHLLSNAIKFTERGHVRFAARMDAGDVVFHVADTGIGISAQDRERLFQPFSQLDAGERRRHPGTGLGLFVSRRLAGLIGASMDFSSTVGEGTEFVVRVPVRRGEH
jgi:signal transduction histidine kinase